MRKVRVFVVFGHWNVCSLKEMCLTFAILAPVCRLRACKRGRELRKSVSPVGAFTIRYSVVPYYYRTTVNWIDDCWKWIYWTTIVLNIRRLSTKISTEPRLPAARTPGVPYWPSPVWSVHLTLTVDLHQRYDKFLFFHFTIIVPTAYGIQ